MKNTGIDEQHRVACWTAHTGGQRIVLRDRVRGQGGQLGVQGCARLGRHRAAHGWRMCRGWADDNYGGRRDRTGDGRSDAQLRPLVRVRL